LNHLVLYNMYAGWHLLSDICEETKEDCRNYKGQSKSKFKF